MRFLPVDELHNEVAAQRDRLRRGEEFFGPWRVSQADQTIEHREVPFGVPLSALRTKRGAVAQLLRAVEKDDAYLSHADVGALARLLDVLGYLPHG